MAESFLTEHGLGWILVIAAVVVLCLIFLVIITPNLNILDILSKLLTGGGTPPAPEAVVLQYALQCSYYRCVKGCNSDEVKRLKYSATENSFDCSEFCKPEFTDTGTADGKVCDDNAKANPVTAEVVASGGEKISLDKLNFAFCLTKVDSCGSGVNYPNFVFIEKSSVKDETKIACRASGNPLSGFSAAIINDGSYKIWTTSYQIIGGWATYVCST
jgi:hypothetical protein